jgi:hypothetical protein
MIVRNLTDRKPIRELFRMNALEVVDVEVGE